MSRKLFNILTIVALLAGFLAVVPAVAVQDDDNDILGYLPNQAEKQGPFRANPSFKFAKDQPNRKDFLRAQERMRLINAGKDAEAAALAQSGSDRVLVILVEFAGTDVFTWTAGLSQWDPLNIANAAESGPGGAGDCSKIITTTQSFTYSGPLHNQIERPLSAADRSGDSIWTEDFNPQWFQDFMFGNGVVISYTRQDSSQVYANFTGQSVRDFYEDLSDGAYTIHGDVVGWLPLAHSTMYYENDQCPGARSTDGTYSAGHYGGWIPEGGNSNQMVKDALDYTNSISNTIPGFAWTNYDQDGDGFIDRLWIVHAGYGEEDSPTLLNRTSYGEGTAWSHSTSIGSYVVDPVNNIKAGPVIMMPENGGIGVFAHEYGHNLGAMDLYAYDQGETSPGFWTLMNDDWTGTPIGFEPPAPDPMHLDWWGWLKPKVISDPSDVYEVKIGQTSRFPGDPDMVRGVRIDLPDGEIPQPVAVWQGSHYWWGGKADEMNSRMTTAAAINLAGTTAPKLSFDLVYDIEDQWDYLWVQASTDGGTTWDTITNTNQVCTHVSGWIGAQNGFPDDTCAAGIYGFTNYNASWPNPELEEFDLTPYAGQNILLRLWYMTDWGTTYTGVFVDDIKVTDGATTIFADDAEAGSAKWVYQPEWVLSNGTKGFKQRYYLQWRNTNANGGYDSALGEASWRYGPANSGLLVWYENESYTDNEVWNYLTDFPSWGPKGRLLLVDANNDPYRDPWMLSKGYNNEGGNIAHRGSMRDAPFTLANTVNFQMTNTYPYTTASLTANYSGLPAVSSFHDSMGYYPGAEFVTRGPGYSPNPAVWISKQWDASAVMPAKTDYALKAPGYTASEVFRMNCVSTNTGRLSCYGYGAGLGYAGGTGNPGDSNVQYGWHVDLIEEAADHTWGKVRIWNSQYALAASLTPSATQLDVNDVVSYAANFQVVGTPMAGGYLACVSFDSDMFEYVAGSANVAPLTMESCPATAAALNSPAAPTKIGALAWMVSDGSLGAKSPTFTFDLKALEPGMTSAKPYGVQTGGGSAPLVAVGGSPSVVVGTVTFFPVINR